ncbi:Alcohol dehydrogenase [acceptor] [Novipirellula caenicola]|uniref:Alcohol dehydrogenase [acceptor] n=2 Tax=Novipirellula caenicola TaxID=1536901 RepID=A0ABP9VYH6_9BACT
MVPGNPNQQTTYRLLPTAPNLDTAASMSSPDILIVGAGSAGCTLAHLLHHQYGYSVTLIEPGAAENPEIVAATEIDHTRPARWLKLLGTSSDWNYATEASQSLAGRSLNCPRGRGVGGSSRINAMIWFSPTDDDFNMFSTAAADDRWSTASLRSAYQAAERLVQPESARWISEPAERFLQAATPFGTPVAYRRMNRNGRRWSPAALIADSSGVQTIRASVDRILFRDDQAVGVKLTNGDEIAAGKRVILSAGSIASPAILMRSGIGPRDLLRDAGAQAWLDAAEVGQHLQDHLVMPVVFSTSAAARFDLNVSPRDLVRFDALGRGPLASNIAEAGGLFASDTLQIHVTPTHYLRFPQPGAPAAMTIAVNPTKPKSRGQLAIRSLDASEPPRIDLRYLTDPADVETTIAGVKLARSIAAQSPLQNWIGPEMVPGAKRDSDQTIAKSISRYAQTLYHPVGTCGLGRVVDADLSVIGTRRLSIVDASVFPEMTVGNPNAMVITLATWFANQLAGAC